MTITLINDNLIHARSLLSIEKESGLICVASSFISSIYFPPKALQRYFQTHRFGAEITEVLIERQKIACNRHPNQRREIYEATAFTNLISHGLVHTEEISYRSTPAEISHVLTRLLDCINNSIVRIGVTREVLPLIYTLSPTNTILIWCKAKAPVSKYTWSSYIR